MPPTQDAARHPVRVWVALARWLLLGLPVLGACGLLLWLSVGGADWLGDGNAPAFTLDHYTLDHYTTVARTYLSRNAFFNTLYSAVPALAIAGGLAWLIYPALTRAGWMRRVTLAVAGAVLLTPLAPSVLLWRTLWEPTLWLTDARGATAAAALVLGWRLAPIGLLAFWYAGRKASLRRAFGVGAWLLGGLALLDTTVVYLLTRGEPFNAAHTAATWALQQAWVAGHWGDASVMLIVLLVLLLMMICVALLGLRLVRILVGQRVLSSVPQARADAAGSAGRRWLGFAGALLLLPLPVWWGAATLDWTQTQATWQWLWAAGAGDWLVNTGLVAGGAAVLAWLLLALWLPRTREPVPRFLRDGLLLAGVVGLGVSFLAVGWLRAHTVLADLDTRVVLAGLYGVVTACIVGGFRGVLALSPPMSPHMSPQRGLLWTAAGAMMLVQQDFALSLFLQPAWDDLILGPAAAMHLAGAPAYPHAVYWLFTGSFAGALLVLLLGHMWGGGRFRRM
ncbi:MAG: hypothetical protein WDZ49_07240 [Litorilinea sp.]